MVVFIDRPVRDPDDVDDASVLDQPVEHPPVPDPKPVARSADEFLDVGSVKRVAPEFVELRADALCFVPRHPQQRLGGVVAELELPRRHGNPYVISWSTMS